MFILYNLTNILDSTWTDNQIFVDEHYRIQITFIVLIF